MKSAEACNVEADGFGVTVIPAYKLVRRLSTDGDGFQRTRHETADPWIVRSVEWSGWTLPGSQLY